MTDNQRILFVLKAVEEIGLPVGATFLSQKLSIPPATIGRILAELEKENLIAKVSNKGRIITDKGKERLAQEELNKTTEKNAAKLVQLIAKADKSTLMEILQARKLLEGYTVQLACQNATETELNELERLMLEHLHIIRNGELGSQLDLEIHLTIAKASRNKTIYQLLKIMLTGDNVYTKFSYVSDNVKHTQIKQHDAIIQALMERSPEKAKEAMEIHLNQIISDLDQYFQEENPQ